MPCGHGAFLFMLFWTPARESLRGQYSGRLKAGLSFESKLLRPAGTGAFPFYVLLAACAAGGVVCTASTMKKAKQGLSFESMLLRPAGTGAFLFM